MKFQSTFFKAVAVMTLALHLLLPPILHAHGLVMVEDDTAHASDIVCLAVDSDTGHGSTDSRESHTGVCLADTPFDTIDIQSPAVKVVSLSIGSPFGGRLLSGYARPLYFPPETVSTYRSGY